MAIEEDIEHALKIMQPKFNTAQLPLPTISKLVLPTTNYDQHEKVFYEGGEQKDPQCPIPFRQFYIGRTVSSYIHHTINTDLLRRVVEEGNDVFNKAKESGNMVPWELREHEYKLLYQLSTTVSQYAGLLFVKDQSGTEGVSEVNEVLIPEATLAQLVPRTKQAAPLAALEAQHWYHQGESWLPKLARITSEVGYKVLVDQANFNSILLHAEL